MKEIGLFLIITGIIAIVAGIMYMTGVHVPIGKLPGDIHTIRPSFKFYFPLTTCILFSIIFTLMIYLLR